MLVNVEVNIQCNVASMLHVMGFKSLYSQWCIVANIYLAVRLPFPSLPLEVGPSFEARGSGGALKLPQRVRTEPGDQTQFVAFWAKIKASGGNNFSDFPDNQLINSSVLRWF